MISTVSSAVLHLAGWSFLPDFATRRLLGFYHQTLRSRGKQTPRSGTPAWVLHYRVTYAIAVLAFLLYNLVHAARSTPPNFFQTLGVTPDADDAVLKNAFRLFAKRHHPDRAGPAGEPLFIAVRDAYEALKNPVKRLAYERFGPSSLAWQNCSTPSDYVRHGLLSAASFYIGTGVVLTAILAMSESSSTAFWRYVLLLGLLASELGLAVESKPSKILRLIFPDRVAFQHVAFLRELFVFLSVALSRVVPVLLPEYPSIRPEHPNTYMPFLHNLDLLNRKANEEVSQLLMTELHSMNTNPVPGATTFDVLGPCQPDKKVLDELSREMVSMFIEQHLRSEPPLRALWDEAVAVTRKPEHRSSLPSDTAAAANSRVHGEKKTKNATRRAMADTTELGEAREERKRMINDGVNV